MKTKFKSIGKNCKISDRVSFYNSEMIEIGDNVRIDDFCVISGGTGISIGSNIHIACYVSMFGGSGIEIADFCQLGAYTVLLSESDDFSGKSLVGPCIPMKFKPQYTGGIPIILEKHVFCGARCTVFPGVHIKEGAAFGAHSLINKNYDKWKIYAGTPARYIRERSLKMLEIEQSFLSEEY